MSLATRLTPASAIVTDHPLAPSGDAPLGSYIQLRLDLGRAYTIDYTLSTQLQKMGTAYVPLRDLTAEQRSWVEALVGEGLV